MTSTTEFFNFTVELYHKMIDLGLFEEDDKVELIDGKIVRMSSEGPKHANTIRKLIKVFRSLLPPHVEFNVQTPIAIDHIGEPEPDFTILKPNIELDDNEHPTVEQILLVIEVAQISIKKDKGLKLQNYASAGIQMYWIIDLNQNQIEIHTIPLGNQYKSVKLFTHEDLIDIPSLNLSIEAQKILLNKK